MEPVMKPIKVAAICAADSLMEFARHVDRTQMTISSINSDRKRSASTQTNATKQYPTKRDVTLPAGRKGPCTNQSTKYWVETLRNWYYV